MPTDHESPSTGRRRIALLLDSRYRLHGEMIEGVRRYCRNKPDWLFRVIQPNQPQQAVAAALDWPADGMIAAYLSRPYTRETTDGVPTVCIGSKPWKAASAWVTYDQDAIGRLAASTLARHPIASAGCIIYPSHSGALLQAEGFRAAMQQAGIPCQIFQERQVTGSAADSYEHLSRQGVTLAHWLSELPKPCGIYGWHDELCLFVLDVAREVGIESPRDLLMVSTGNDSRLCGISTPPFSSIEIPFLQAGWEAARLLDNILRGEPPEAPVVLPPLSVHERQSTAWVGTGDPLVLQALTLIDRGWLDHRTVADLCRELGCKRRTLERRFRAELKKTVHEALQEHRVRLAIAMLRDGVYSVAAIARECGFKASTTLEALLKKQTGRLPREFRGYRP
jgi:LacI family transcriptional regulator